MTKTLIGILLAIGASAGATGLAHAENAMYSCAEASGSVSLTNVPVGQCVQLFTYAPPAAEPAAATAAATGTASAAVVSGIVAEVPVARSVQTDAKPVAARERSPKPILAQRRDDAIQAARAAYGAGQPSVMGNPATSRRYLMTNRVDYQKALGIIQ